MVKKLLAAGALAAATAAIIAVIRSKTEKDECDEYDEFDDEPDIPDGEEPDFPDEDEEDVNFDSHECREKILGGKKCDNRKEGCSSFIKLNAPSLRLSDLQSLDKAIRSWDKKRFAPFTAKQICGFINHHELEKIAAYFAKRSRGDEVIVTAVNAALNTATAELSAKQAMFKVNDKFFNEYEVEKVVAAFDTALDNLSEFLLRMDTSALVDDNGRTWEEILNKFGNDRKSVAIGIAAATVKEHKKEFLADIRRSLDADDTTESYFNADWLYVETPAEPEDLEKSIDELLKDADKALAEQNETDLDDVAFSAEEIEKEIKETKKRRTKKEADKEIDR